MRWIEVRYRCTVDDLRLFSQLLTETVMAGAWSEQHHASAIYTRQRWYDRTVWVIELATGGALIRIRDEVNMIRVAWPHEGCNDLLVALDARWLASGRNEPHGIPEIAQVIEIALRGYTGRKFQAVGAEFSEDNRAMALDKVLHAAECTPFRSFNIHFDDIETLFFTQEGVEINSLDLIGAPGRIILTDPAIAVIHAKADNSGEIRHRIWMHRDVGKPVRLKAHS
jgi:hypothetical protein